MCQNFIKPPFKNISNMLQPLTEKALAKLPSATTHVRVLFTTRGTLYIADYGTERNLRVREHLTRWSDGARTVIMTRQEAEELSRNQLKQ